MANRIHNLIVNAEAEIINDQGWPARTGEEIVWLPTEDDLVLDIKFIGNPPVKDAEMGSNKGMPIRATITAIVVGSKVYRYKLKVVRQDSLTAADPAPAKESEPEIIIDGGGINPAGRKTGRKKKKKAAKR